MKGDCLNFLRSYLSSRCQYTEVYGKTLGKSKIDIGVPHGSVRGPLPFLIHINDISDQSLSIQSTNFAEDTDLICNPKQSAIHTDKKTLGTG